MNGSVELPSARCTLATRSRPPIMRLRGERVGSRNAGLRSSAAASAKSRHAKTTEVATRRVRQYAPMRVSPAAAAAHSPGYRKASQFGSLPRRIAELAKQASGTSVRAATRRAAVVRGQRRTPTPIAATTGPAPRISTPTSSSRWLSSATPAYPRWNPNLNVTKSWRAFHQRFGRKMSRVVAPASQGHFVRSSARNSRSSATSTTRPGRRKYAVYLLSSARPHAAPTRSQRAPRARQASQHNAA